MNAVINVFKEQLSHKELIIKLAIYNIKSQYSNHYLGAFWNLLQPALQVLLYYIVFGLGLRGAHSDIEDVPFIVYLISGLFPWLFISQSVNAGASAIQSQIALVTKMKFPSSILLSISFTNALINLIITSSIIFIISIFMNLVPIWHYIYVLYFIFCSYILLFAISLLMSTLVILIRDTKNILQNLLRMGFFLTPIFWSVQHTSHIMLVISNLNPFSYLLGIYRLAFINGSSHLYGGLSDHLYYWSFTFLMLIIGASVHMKFRNQLVDYL